MPLTRWPGAFAARDRRRSASRHPRSRSPSPSRSRRSPASTPGVKAPKAAGVPSATASVGGTVPPTGDAGGATIDTSACETSKKTLPIASILIRALARGDVREHDARRSVVGRGGREHVRERRAAVRGQADLHVGDVDRRDVGAGHVPGDRLAARCRRRPARSPARSRGTGPANGASVSLVAALPTPPPPSLASRAVRRKFSVRSPRTPTQSAVGRNSEKQSTVAGGTGAGEGGAVGQAPVAAFVLPARICAMSGNDPGRVGVGHVLARRGVSSVSVVADAAPRSRTGGTAGRLVLVVRDQRGPGRAADVVLLPHVGERVAVGVGGAAGQRERRPQRDRVRGRGRHHRARGCRSA